MCQQVVTRPFGQRIAHIMLSSSIDPNVAISFLNLSCEAPEYPRETLQFHTQQIPKAQNQSRRHDGLDEEKVQ